MAKTDNPWLWKPTEDVPAVRGTIPLRVARYDELAEDATDAYETLDAVVCVQIQEHEGVDPGTCRLRYRFSFDRPDDGSPRTFEEALSTRSERPKAIEPYDRIVVIATRPDGVEEYAFDGYAVGFELGLGPRKEVVSILCVGVAIRAWDEPIEGSLWRDGEDPSKVADHQIDAIPHFNPKGKGNCCPKDSPPGEDADTAYWGPKGADPGKKYPAFIDPDNPATGDKAPTKWTLAKAGRYLLWKHNPLETYVKNQDGVILDEVLAGYEGFPGKPLDYDDPETYTRTDIIVPDKPINSKDWPSALRDLIADKGYLQNWLLGKDENGDPQTEINIQASQRGEIKDLWLQPRGSQLDAALSNMQGADLTRDIAQVINDWTVEGELEEIEASFVLACAFAADPADAASTSIVARYDRSGADFAKLYHDAYRTWIFGEGGDPYYAPGGNTLVTATTPSLDDLLGKPIDGEAQYAHRRRKPLGELVTLDPQKKPLRARLAISTDYAGPKPGLWDGTGTWQPVTNGWELLKDRIGIWIDADNPNGWKIGKSSTTGHPFRSGVVKAIEGLAKPNATNKVFYLRLTCVIRGDRRLKGRAREQDNPVITHAIRRYIDAHDRYKKRWIAPKSEFNATSDPVISRDDTALALAEASARQLASRDGILEGTVTIPRFDRYYQIGDRIRSIQGRDFGFRTNGEDDPDAPSYPAAAAPTYPIVVGRTHAIEGNRQVTHLKLSDANAARRSYHSSYRRTPDVRRRLR